MSVGILFDAGARDYDRARRQLVPNFDAFYGAVFDLLPFEKDRPVRVLDLGAGTGLLSAMVAERFPQAMITLADVSGEMLEVARRRFASDFARFGFRVMDYAGEEDWGSTRSSSPPSRYITWRTLTSGGFSAGPTRASLPAEHS